MSLWLFAAIIAAVIGLVFGIVIESRRLRREPPLNRMQTSVRGQASLVFLLLGVVTLAGSSTCYDIGAMYAYPTAIAVSVVFAAAGYFACALFGANLGTIVRDVFSRNEVRS